MMFAMVALGGTFPSTSRAQGPAVPPCQQIGGLTEITLYGEIVDVAFPVATLKTEDGKIYRMRLGPWWFWTEKNYTLQPGEWVEVNGFKSGDLIFPRIIKTANGTLRLRDRRGIPLWRKGAGWGRGFYRRRFAPWHRPLRRGLR